MGLTKSMSRLIQFNRESIKVNIYVTQANCTINIKRVYYMKVESHNLTYIWVDNNQIDNSEVNYQAQNNCRIRNVHTEDHVDLSVLLMAVDV